MFTAALVWSLFVFVALYVSRLNQTFDGAFINFGYFLGTLFILRSTRPPSEPSRGA